MAKIWLDSAVRVMRGKVGDGVGRRLSYAGCQITARLRPAGPGSRPLSI